MIVSGQSPNYTYGIIAVYKMSYKFQFTIDFLVFNNMLT